MLKHEERKVITLCGDRGWHDPDPDLYSPDSVLRGYRHLNERINRLAQKVTIHSVSYSSEPFPGAKPGVPRLIRLFATIVYSGQLDILDEFGDVDSSTGKSRRPDETVIQMTL